MTSTTKDGTENLKVVVTLPEYPSNLPDEPTAEAKAAEAKAARRR